MRLLISTFLLVLFAGCNSPKAIYDYDREIDFSSFSTYQFYPELETGLSDLDHKRLLESISHQLKESGLIKSDEPGLYVNMYTRRFERDNRTRLGVGVGGSGRNVGVGVSGGIPVGSMDAYLQLTFDIIDARNDALIWQAVVESPFDRNATPTERKERFDKIVQKAFSNYPPKRNK